MNDYTQTPNSDIYNYNVIYDDEDVIGKVLDIKKCFIHQLSVTLSDNEIDIEEKIERNNLINDLLEQIKEEHDNTIIKVSFNPMGAFYYKHLNWEE